MFGLGFKHQRAMVWTFVSHLQECQIALTENTRPSYRKRGSLYTLTLLTCHTDYSGRMSQMEMFSLVGLSMQNLDFIWTTIAGQ